jgi:TonB family C-terminal domain
VDASVEFEHSTVHCVVDCFKHQSPADGIRFACFFNVLHFDFLVTRTPQLPRRRFDALTQLGTSAALHLMVFTIVSFVASMFPSHIVVQRTLPTAAHETIDLRHIVFLAPELHQVGGGGGGGGNRQPGPIRRAQGVGSDAFTLRVRKPQPPAVPEASSQSPAQDVSAFPSIVLDAKPLASGAFEQLGLPTGGVLSSTSTGPGSGGGVGTGTGTGIGPGRGSGLGSGSGGGVGGGVYRAGGAVTAPRVITEVKPNYTPAALVQRIQGSVVLEVVVTHDGCASRIRVIRSLDPGGLDQEAMNATAQWRFEPGRLAGVPVDVLVNVMLDFTIR